MNDATAHSAPLAIGTQVRVTNHEPMPPTRFTKKLREWTSHNYEGAVVRIEGDRYTIQSKPAAGWGSLTFIVMLHSGMPRSRLVPMEGAPLLPVRGDSMDACVDPSAVVQAGLQAA